MKSISQTNGFHGYGDNGFRRASLRGVYLPNKAFDNKGQSVSKNLFNSRTAMYKTNGQGRDSYIHLDNGGFTTMHQSVNYQKPGTMKSPVQYFSKPNPVMEAKNIFYRSNGTGRDTYIE